MYDDLLTGPRKEKSIKQALKDMGVGKCRECTSYQNANGLCNKIIKVVSPDQIGCLDFAKK